MSTISETTESEFGSNAGGVTDEDTTAPRIRAFLVDSFLLGDDDGFAEDESLLDAGIIDSTGVMEVVTFLEESFGIAIDDDELVADNLDSVARLSSFVHRKLSA